MAEIEWTSRAFRILKTLPQAIAFEIIRQVDYLQQFPNLGVNLSSRFVSLKDYPQIIIKRKYRVIYDYDDFEKLLTELYVDVPTSPKGKLPRFSFTYPSVG